MRSIWIVIADAGRARILSKVEGVRGLNIVEQIENPQARLHNVDLVSDQRGAMKKHGGSAKSAMDMRTEPHEQKAVEFARELNHLLHKAAGERTFDLLAVVAPPHFLGLMRSGMSPELQNKLVLCKAHDFTRLSHADLEGEMEEELEFPAAAGTGNRKGR